MKKVPKSINSRVSSNTESIIKNLFKCFSQKNKIMNIIANWASFVLIIFLARNFLENWHPLSLDNSALGLLARKIASELEIRIADKCFLNFLLTKYFSLFLRNPPFGPPSFAPPLLSNVELRLRVCANTYAHSWIMEA